MVTLFQFLESECDMEFDRFEELWQQESAPAVKLPPDGAHLFTVKAATWFEDSGKLSLFLTTADGFAINKKCYLRDPDKAGQNKQWLSCLFDAAPSGAYADFDWSAVEGKKISAQVGRFTPVDREDEICFVNRPVRPLEEAVVRKPKTSRTAKVDRETVADKTDVPF